MKREESGYSTELEQATNGANRMCASKKKEWINNIIRQIEENHKKNEPRKFFSEIKKLRQQNTGLPHM